MFLLPLSLTLLVAILSLLYLYLRQRPPPPTYSVPVPVESLPHWKGRRVAATLRTADEPDMVQCLCPATGQFLGKFPAHSPSDMDVAIGAAKAAQSAWAATSVAKRKAVLECLSAYILAHQEELARVACRDLGKTMVDAAMGEILTTLEKLAWTVRHGERSIAREARVGPANMLMRYKGAEVVYEPLGVVASIVLWNYPFHNLMGPVIAALFTGNAICVKVLEQVLWLLRYFISVVQGALQACGHSPELVQLVCCWPEDAAHFVAHKDLAHITFIGLHPVAQKVLAAAAESVTPVVTELGGKDAFVVLEDAGRVEAIALIVMRGTFQLAGQNCIGIERVVAVGTAYPPLVLVLARRIPEIRVGSDIDQLEEIDMGALISGSRTEHLEKLIAAAVADGARLLAGGHRFAHPNYPQGHYFEPTLLVDVTPAMQIAQEEVFGPVCVVMRAESQAEAVEIANSTQYGLGALVFGSYRAAREVAHALHAGNVAINDFATFYLCQLPFGGTRGSGFGKFGGEEGLRGLMVAKSVCYDRLPGIQTAIPKPLDYPIADGRRAWGFVASLNTAGYARSLWGQLQGLAGLARNGT